MNQAVSQSDSIREEILMTARDFFYLKGYHNTSINHIIREIGIAKGTFYYYYQSKEELLSEIIRMIVDKKRPDFEEYFNRSGDDFVQKLSGLLRMIVNDLPVSKQDYLFIIQPFYCDENIYMRHRLLQAKIDTFLPYFIKTAENGIRQGFINTMYPVEAMEMTLQIGYDLNDELIRHLLFHSPDKHFMDRMIRKYSIYEITAENILGLPIGSLSILDMNKLKNMLTLKNELSA